MKAKCILCGASKHVDSFDDWTCEKCGQQYEYEEGHRIVLTEEQIEWLRELQGHQLKDLLNLVDSARGY